MLGLLGSETSGIATLATALTMPAAATTYADPYVVETCPIPSEEHQVSSGSTQEVARKNSAVYGC